MKSCRKANGLSPTIQKQNTMLTSQCKYLPTVCRQEGVWTLCLGTPGTWMCPHYALPNSSWLAAHHLKCHSDSGWACSGTSYKLQSAHAPNTHQQKRNGSCNITSKRQQQCVCCSILLIAHISRAPVLHHGDDVSELHLQSERCLPLRFHFNVLSHLSNHWVHPLRDRHICELDALKVYLSTCAGEGVFCCVTCIHFNSSRKASRPSRNLNLSWSVQSDGRLIRTYLQTTYNFREIRICAS